MVKKLLFASLVVIVLALVFPVAAFADDPNCAPNPPTVNVTVTTDGGTINSNVTNNGDVINSTETNNGDTVNATVNVNSPDGSVGINGDLKGVTINGQPVATQNDVQSSLRNASQANGWWQNSVGAQLYSHQNQLTAIENHVVLDEAALSKLISQGQDSDKDISALQKSSQNLYQDIDLLTGQLNDLNDRIDAANTNATEQIYALQQKNNALEQESNALEQELASLNGKISDLQQAQYLQEHSGFVYNIKTFFGNLFNGVKNYVCQIRAN